MKTLPEKWAIKTDDPKFFEWFNKLDGVSKGLFYPYDECDKVFTHYPSYDEDGDCFLCEVLQEGYEEITLDQWRECMAYKKELEKVMSQDFGTAKFSPDATVESSTRQPIAYKVKTKDVHPFNIGNILSDFEREYWYRKNERYHCVSQNLIDKLGPDYFEPIYEEEKPKKEVRTCWIIKLIEQSWTLIVRDEKDKIKEFPSEPEAHQWVREHGEKGKYYSYHEVDYIV